MLKPTTEILEQMEKDYPQLSKFFKPEIRKIQDIALRERKICGVKPREPKINEKIYKRSTVKKEEPIN